MSKSSAHSADCDVPGTCLHCGGSIDERYAGTFWKAPDPMPTIWVHVLTGDRACGYAEPHPIASAKPAI